MEKITQNSPEPNLSSINGCAVYNCDTFLNIDIPILNGNEFSDEIKDGFQEGCRISSFYASEFEDKYRITAVLSDCVNSQLRILSTIINNDEPWESLTHSVPSVHMFEREISEQWGITLKNHPWPKPVRFLSAGRKENREVLPAVTEFYRVNGEEIHEVAVGPVHAGIIEPGHFRFQCYGEIVYHLEIALGFQHRGIEKMIPGGPNSKTVYYMENIAGDTAIGHTLAYCQIIESLSGIMISARAEALRGIALELERLANHTGDLGALAGDIGYLPTASFCGRIRGDFLNISALLCGSRFGRGFVRPGGVAYDIDVKRIQELEKRLNAAYKDVENAVNLLWETPSVPARFEGTGVLSTNEAMELGLVGPAARACGLTCDVRNDYPSGIYRFFNVPVSSWHTGDVFARAYVRWLEIQRSFAFINELIKSLPEGEVMIKPGNLSPDSSVVSLIEGWRGEICHFAQTDGNGKLILYKITDPSFHNWTGLATALRNQPISDFPLCNKSFNLSYCGHDL